jgi:rRNA biogenesis protein RRP5
VLRVDPDRKRIVLTAKKTLIESTLPVLATMEDAQVGQIVHATVQKATDKALIVEFYNNLKGIVTAREAV